MTATSADRQDAMTEAASGERTALSPEASHFLVQLSIALAKIATYPEGHPSLESAVQSLTLRLDHLLTERHTIGIGVAKDRLVMEGGTTDSSNALLRGLAEALHRHQIGALTFSRGVSPVEVSSFLAALAQEVRTEAPLGSLDPADLDRWPNIGLLPVALDELELAESTSRSTHLEQLWLSMAAATLQRGPEEIGQGRVGSSDLARAIRANAHDASYDRVIADYMRRVSRELAERGDVGSSVALQMGDLLSSVDVETMSMLLELGSDRSARVELVRDMSRVLPAKAVVSLAKATADASKRSISESLLRLFTKLASNIEQAPAAVSAASDSALRDAINQLSEGWTLADPNPEMYRGLLVDLARPSHNARSLSETEPWIDALRIVHVSLDTSAVGPAVWRCLSQLIDFGRLEEIVAALDRASSDEMVARIRDYLAQPATVLRILSTHQSRKAVDRILDWTRLESADVLLDSLENADSRATRRQIIARLKDFGPPLGPMLVDRLERGPWYVQRNMLYLLAEIDWIPPDFAPDRWLELEDDRVRHEAIRVALRVKGWRTQAITIGLDDDDPRILKLVLDAALEDCPPGIGRALIDLIEEKNIDRSIRLRAIRALGLVRTPESRDWLIHQAAGKRRWWRRQRIAPKSPEVLTALSTLREFWAGQPLVEQTLKRALRSNDPDIRAAAATPDLAA
jgi:hypothetical protein